jgi:hypothetical protein
MTGRESREAFLMKHIETESVHTNENVCIDSHD